MSHLTNQVRETHPEETNIDEWILKNVVCKCGCACACDFGCVCIVYCLVWSSQEPQHTESPALSLIRRLNSKMLKSQSLMETNILENYEFVFNIHLCVDWFCLWTVHFNWRRNDLILPHEYVYMDYCQVQMLCVPTINYFKEKICNHICIVDQ